MNRMIKGLVGMLVLGGVLLIMSGEQAQAGGWGFSYNSGYSSGYGYGVPYQSYSFNTAVPYYSSYTPSFSFYSGTPVYTYVNPGCQFQTYRPYHHHYHHHRHGHHHH